MRGRARTDAYLVTVAMNGGDAGGQCGAVAIVDVHYEPDRAICAGIVAQRWIDQSPCEELVVTLPEARPYKPGAFFERELPCLVAVLSRLRTAFATIVIDGYVVLDAHGTPGLGAHLHAHWAAAFAVVGVAKTFYRGCDIAVPVRRGLSQRPLFVTAAGVETARAAQFVHDMHGAHRVPTLIAHVDRLARDAARQPS